MQVQYDLELFTENNLLHYYGVDYTYGSPDKLYTYYSLTLKDDRGNVQKEEILRQNPELEDFLKYQKLVLTKYPYLTGFFDENLNEATLNGFNVLTIHEYLPLPSMPELEVLVADLRNFDICPNSLQILNEIISEVHRVAPRCRIVLISLICIN
ncbi:unnamed protein product [Bursaphelenchus okinawaensis]|uniref:Uncharacterized protein n=1 Tax=Bursaphelenchus okinawaensis TaxID=465554 RepID=A0A811L8W6_9BILA|nr:unnamed protein product [Bursaphelenchus okinawaensis]CAG9118275.1 unnamed protein product [Bursaphelenchus okinawaensis]